jgi:hypothetical protein
MSRSIRVLGLLLPFMAAVSCGGGGYTHGNFCSEIGKAVCARAVECEFETSISACASEFQASCCGDAGDCGQKAPSEFEDAARDQAHSCAIAFDNYDCEQLYYMYLPDACYGAVGALVPANITARQSTLPAAKAAGTARLDARLLGGATRQRLLQTPVTGPAQ